MNTMKHISAIQGRHADKTVGVEEYFSEHALMKYRTMVEIEYLLALSDEDSFPMRELTVGETDVLKKISSEFSEECSDTIYKIDRVGFNGRPATDHDVKAVELFIKYKLEGTSLSDITELIHWGLTSADVNNLAYTLMYRDFVRDMYLPKIQDLCNLWIGWVGEEKSTPMMSRTHGQPATPTTFGKEIANFLNRLMTQVSNINLSGLTGKLNGAVGNFNAMHVACPDVDWISFSTKFVKKFDLVPNIFTTQIEPHDSKVESFQRLVRINNILSGFSVDMWLYIMQDYVVQEVITGEVGSSTMPHKVNPWRFECAEGQLHESNSRLNGYCDKLTKSRLQRDLSDHEALRSIGDGVSY